MLAVIVAQAIAHDCLAGMQGSYFSELFDTRTRLSGASLGYQLSASISGFIPLLAASLAAAFGWAGVAALFTAVGLIGLVTVSFTRETWPGNMRGPQPSGAPEAVRTPVQLT